MSAVHRSDHVSSPNNPTLIKFKRSDGDARTWPSNTKKNVNFLGVVNYMKPLPLHGNGTAMNWKLGVAAGLATLLNLPKGPIYALDEFPKGYHLFEHRTGAQNAPRRNPYLYGAKRRFRSIPEFIPHAFWLLHDPSLACECTYCSKELQRKINSSMGLLPWSQLRCIMENTVSKKGPKPRRALIRKPATAKTGKWNGAKVPSSVRSDSSSKRDSAEVEAMLIPSSESESDEEIDQLDEDSYL